jgi:DNA-binding LacI/PurR family transcriptional regulator
VPEELSIIGCSDDPNLLWTHPQLTTIHLPAEEMAELGVREISRLVGEGAPGAPQKTFLSARLVERGSCVAI